MERVIKFRGTSKFNKEFVYGDLIHGVAHKEGNVYILPRVKNLASVPGCDPLDGVKVFPETVGQFTGLTDKNGKEIYEGDVVISSKSLNKEVGVVVSERGCFYLKVNEKTKYLIFWFSDEKGEIIGNMHDNPELLKL